MPAPVIEFETAVPARREPGGVAIALIAGAEPVCVAILLCSDEVARGLAQALGTMLPPPQA